MSQEPELIPVACNPQVLSSEEWAAHQATTAALFAQAVEPPQELADGYAFRFPAAAFSGVATFIDGERRCCPFFAFTVEVPPADDVLTLRITGSSEAKAVLAANLAPSADTSYPARV